MHSVGGRAHQFAGVLERVSPRQRQGEVSKIAGTRAAHPRLFDGQYAFHLLHFATI